MGDSELVEKFLQAKKDGKSPLSVLVSMHHEHAQKGSSDVHRHRRNERDADEEDIEEEFEEEDPDNVGVVFTESPAYIKNGKMRDYQVQGLNWLVNLYHHSINGILADEMVLFYLVLYS